jgi:hypothetical protein
MVSLLSTKAECNPTSLAGTAGLDADTRPELVVVVVVVVVVGPKSGSDTCEVDKYDSVGVRLDMPISIPPEVMPIAMPSPDPEPDPFRRKDMDRRSVDQDFCR